MKFVICLIALCVAVQAAPQGPLPADLTQEQAIQYLDDPVAADALLECFKDFGASSGTMCPEGLRHASQMVQSIGTDGGCADCTEEENQLLAQFVGALVQRPELFNRFLQAFPSLAGQGK